MRTEERVQESGDERRHEVITCVKVERSDKCLTARLFQCFCIFKCCTQQEKKVPVVTVSK